MIIIHICHQSFQNKNWLLISVFLSCINVTTNENVDFFANPQTELCDLLKCFLASKMKTLHLICNPVEVMMSSAIFGQIFIPFKISAIVLLLWFCHVCACLRTNQPPFKTSFFWCLKTIFFLTADVILLASLRLALKLVLVQSKSSCDKDEGKKFCR